MGRAGLRELAAADAVQDAPFDDGSSASLIAKTQAAIRRDIIRHVLSPGKRLKIQDLTGRYGVGLSPIREALSLLAGDGLVIREDRRGFRVAPLTLADYQDVQLVFGRLWPFALRLSLTNGDHAWEQRLLLALHRTLKFDWVRAEQEPRLYDDWDRMFRDFAHELTAGSGSPTLTGLIDTLVDRIERYRWLAPEVKADTALDDRNHRALVDAIIARDGDRLRQAVHDYAAGGLEQRDAIEAKLNGMTPQTNRRGATT